MNSEKDKEKEKQANAGNPLFVVIILVALVGFLYVIPEVYKRYNKNIADFLGVGKNNEEVEKEIEEEKENEIEAKSGFYFVNYKGSFTYNEFEISDTSVQNEIMTLHLSTADTVDLKDRDYYIEFYENQSKFLGRRRLKGIVTRTLNVKIDVSGLNIGANTYFLVSHISDDVIPNIPAEKGEANQPSLTCTKGNNTYIYDFSEKKLSKVTNKYSYTNTDMNIYSSTLLEYQKKEKEYQELTGVASNIVESNNNFIFTASFEYEKVKNFSRVKDDNLFTKDEKDNVIKFRMEAEGFDCQ